MRVLLDLEQRLQSWEVSLKDCQLPELTTADVALVQQLDAALNLPATIREELDFDVEEMEFLARFSSLQILRLIIIVITIIISLQ